MERVKRHLRRVRRAAYRPVVAVRRLTFWQKMAILFAAVILCATIDYALNYRRDHPAPQATEHSLHPDAWGVAGTGSGNSHPYMTILRMCCARIGYANSLA